MFRKKSGANISDAFTVKFSAQDYDKNYRYPVKEDSECIKF